MGAVVIAGGAAVTLFHLTLPAISAVLAPVFDATGGLVGVTLLLVVLGILVAWPSLLGWLGIDVSRLEPSS